MGEHMLFDGRPVLQFRSNHDRRAFLKWAGMVGVGASFVAGGLLGVPTWAEAEEIRAETKQKARGKADTDIDILNYALTLEYLEADFYAMGVSKNLLSGRELELVTPIADHETTHVSAVTATITALGGTPVAKPTITYPAGTFDTRESFLTTASVFEELGVTAYHGQITLITSLDVLAAGASIAGSESRHAAVIATLIGGNPFPAPFEGHKTKEEVLAEVTPLIS